MTLSFSVPGHMMWSSLLPQRPSSLVRPLLLMVAGCCSLLVSTSTPSRTRALFLQVASSTLSVLVWISSCPGGSMLLVCLGHALMVGGVTLVVTTPTNLVTGPRLVSLTLEEGA